jgi:hypothetical protein
VDSEPAWYEEDPTVAADRAAAFFGVAPDDASRRRGVRGFLLGAATAAGLVPTLFVLRFGYIDGFGWGATVFLVVLQLLGALALFFRPRTEYHTPVRAKGDWVDKIGGWWLMVCAFGAFSGWVLTAVVPVTAVTWWWVYGAKVFVTIVLPVTTAIPLTRYARGKATLVAVPLLVVVTTLPVLTGLTSARDLWTGPPAALHTGRVLCG